MCLCLCFFAKSKHKQSHLRILFPLKQSHVVGTTASPGQRSVFTNVAAHQQTQEPTEQKSS